MVLLKKRVLFILALGLMSFPLNETDALAAPCCAGSNAVPALITGDEAQTIQFGVSAGSVIGDAPGASMGLPVFRDSLSPKESKQTLALSYARLLDGDRWQGGVSIPFQNNSLAQNGKSESSFSMSDLSLTLGYEAIPEWDYSVMKPRVFTFLQVTLPTGRSIYDSQTILSTDASGSGQAQIALGGVAIKRWSDFDANAVMKLGRILGAQFKGSMGSNGATQVSESDAATAAIGAGYSFLERYRLGSSLSWEYQSPIRVTSTGLESVASQRMVWTTGLNLSYLSGSDDSFVFGYQDQTLFGPALNTSLSRTFSLAFIHRVER